MFILREAPITGEVRWNMEGTLQYRKGKSSTWGGGGLKRNWFGRCGSCSVNLIPKVELHMGSLVDADSGIIFLG